jgi:hypothetical protein
MKISRLLLSLLVLAGLTAGAVLPAMAHVNGPPPPNGDVTPPCVWCVESVNPHGKTVPPAGYSTLPGPKGGKNEDGFYRICASDNVDPAPDIYVGTNCANPEFGPFSSGTVVKITQAPGAAPSIKKIGSTNGQAGAVAWHITLPTDPVIKAVDSSGNYKCCSCCCPVPPPPK